MHFLACPEYSVFGEIEGKFPQVQLVANSGTSASQRSAHPSKQFSYTKGLGQVVIRSCIQCSNLGVLKAAGRKHDDREGALGTQFA